MKAFSLPDGGRIFHASAERVIALGRLILAAFALFGVAVGHVPSGGAAGAIWLMAGLYLAAAGMQVLLIGRQPPSQREQVLMHAVDIASVSTLMYLAAGPTSPFFVFFTFILLAGTLRWNWRGALWTAALLAAVFAALVGLFGGRPAGEPPGQLDEPVLRFGYLLVAGAMLGYVGAYRERSRFRLARLVAWPGPDRGAEGAAPPIAAALAHAAALMQARRVLVVWEQAAEPSRHVALWSEGRLRHSRERAGRFGTLVAARRAGDTFAIPRAEPRDGHAAPALLDEELRQAFEIRDALTAPFRLPLCRGRVFLLDRRRAGNDDLLLAGFVALRVGVDLEHHLLRSQSETNAAMAERVRLARDLHDGVLQSLTAANIQLKLLAQRTEGELAGRLTGIRQCLTEEQRRVRAFVEDHRPLPGAAPERVDLASDAERHLRRLQEAWNCRVDFEATPADLTAPPEIARHVRNVLAEAVSNAVRHGRASRIAVSAARSGGFLQLRITDDGTGFAGLGDACDRPAPAAPPGGPWSLRTRIRELGGTLSLRTGPSGSELRVGLPL